MSTTQQPQAGVKKFEESTLVMVQDKISSFISSGDIKIPTNYSPENAVRSAWLMLQEQKDKNDRPVLESCTVASISNALLKMVVQGLSIVKGQCYFIPYGNVLTFQRSYAGAVSLAKRVSNVIDIKANAIYKGDEFAFEVDAATGRRKILKHTQTLESIDHENVVGAYAIVFLEDGSQDVEIMNMKQIRKAWEQGATKGSSPAHKNFTDEMACKTVINRAVKLKINTSNDSDLFQEDEIEGDPQSANVKQTIKDNANKEALTFDDAVYEEESKPETKTEPAIQPNKNFEAEKTPEKTIEEQPETGQVKAPF